MAERNRETSRCKADGETAEFNTVAATEEERERSQKKINKKNSGHFGIGASIKFEGERESQKKKKKRNIV